MLAWRSVYNSITSILWSRSLFLWYCVENKITQLSIAIIAAEHKKTIGQISQHTVNIEQMFIIQKHNRPSTLISCGISHRNNASSRCSFTVYTPLNLTPFSMHVFVPSEYTKKIGVTRHWKHRDSIHGAFTPVVTLFNSRKKLSMVYVRRLVVR